MDIEGFEPTEIVLMKVAHWLEKYRFLKLMILMSAWFHRDDSHIISPLTPQAIY